jgi:hypothetical protein
MGGRKTELEDGEAVGGADFQRVVVPQLLQERMTPWPVAQMSASMLVSSILSSAPQELQARERRPISFSRWEIGGKSISQKLRFESKKATP